MVSWSSHDSGPRGCRSDEGVTIEFGPWGEGERVGIDADGTGSEVDGVAGGEWTRNERIAWLMNAWSSMKKINNFLPFSY